MQIAQSQSGRSPAPRVSFAVFAQDVARADGVVAKYPFLASRATFFRALMNGWDKLSPQQQDECVLNVKPPTT